jgi:nickel-dependent lactate racemase
MKGVAAGGLAGCAGPLAVAFGSCLTMRIGIDYGCEHLDLDLPEGSLVNARRGTPAFPPPDPAEAVRAALEKPHGFPPLRRALTPDDHITVVVDESLPQLVRLLTPLLEYLVEAKVAAEAITLLSPTGSAQTWVDDLPEAFQEVKLEVHTPADRRRLAYLATTKQGRRIYLNRTAVEADQVIVLGRRGYDPVLGYSGAVGALYPALGDEEALREANTQLSLAPPESKAWPLRDEATEVAWLLGAPFFVQVIEGAGDEVDQVVGGLVDSSTEAERLLEARWRVRVPEAVDTVIGGIRGKAGSAGFGELARAAMAAGRVVKSGGRIILLSQVPAVSGEGSDLVRQAEDPEGALKTLRKSKLLDPAPAFLWAHAAQDVQLYLLSGLPEETAEELFATPLEDVRQVQRLVDRGGSTLLLADADKTMAVLDAS